MVKRKDKTVQGTAGGIFIVIGIIGAIYSSVNDVLVGSILSLIASIAGVVLIAFAVSE